MKRISNLKTGYTSFEVKGFEEYLEAIVQAGLNVDDAVADAVVESAQPIQQDIGAWAQKHKLTGATLMGVIKPVAVRDGNVISAEVGISGEGESWHAVFREYGSPHNRPADPGVRTAFENNIGKVRRIQREVLKKAGVPVDG